MSVFKRIGKFVKREAKKEGRIAAKITKKIVVPVTAVVAAGASYFGGPVAGAAVAGIGSGIARYAGATAARAHGVQGLKARQAGRKLQKKTLKYGLIGATGGALGAGIVAVASGASVLGGLGTAAAGTAGSKLLGISGGAATPQTNGFVDLPETGYSYAPPVGFTPVEGADALPAGSPYAGAGGGNTQSWTGPQGNGDWVGETTRTVLPGTGGGSSGSPSFLQSLGLAAATGVIGGASKILAPSGTKPAAAGEGTAYYRGALDSLLGILPDSLQGQAKGLENQLLGPAQSGGGTDFSTILIYGGIAFLGAKALKVI